MTTSQASKVLPAILDCEKEWRSVVPGSSDEEVARLSVAGFCSRTSPSNAFKGSSDGTDVESYLSFLYSVNLRNVRGSLQSNRPTIAIFLHEHCPLYNQQQIYLLNELKRDSRYNTVVVSAIEPHPIHNFDLDPAWFDVPILQLQNIAQLQGLDWIDVVIALDFCASKPIKFPPRAKRVNQVHGTDIKFQYSVEFYGAGQLFDYLLAPCFSPEIIPADYRSRYYNVFPRCLIDHGSRELRVIPFGSAKLDSFIARAENQRKTDLIYNISLWGLETAFVHQNLTKTIRLLLEEFPERRLIFRSFPGERDTLEPFIAEFRTFPNFFVSTANSYIDDYAAGAALLYHRGSSAEVFALATCSPIIRFDGHDDSTVGVTKNELGFVVRTHGDLIGTLKTILKDHDLIQGEIRTYRDKILPHAGRSIPYFLDCIERIIADEPMPEWKRILLFDLSESESVTKERVLQSAEICQRANYVVPMLASASADAFPSEASLQFEAAKSIFEHIYPGERTREPWIEGLRYTARFLKLKSSSDGHLAAGDLTERMTTWLMTVFPERFVGLMAFAFKFCREQELQSIRTILTDMPLDTLDPLGIPQMMRDYRERVGNRSSEVHMLTEIVTLKNKLAIEYLNQGRYSEAEQLLGEIQCATPNNPGVLFLLAHTFKGQGRYRECAQLLEALLQMHPNLEDVTSMYAEVKNILANA